MNNKGVPGQNTLLGSNSFRMFQPDGLCQPCPRTTFNQGCAATLHKKSPFQSTQVVCWPQLVRVAERSDSLCLVHVSALRFLLSPHHACCLRRVVALQTSGHFITSSPNSTLQSLTYSIAVKVEQLSLMKSMQWHTAACDTLPTHVRDFASSSPNWTLCTY